MRMQTLTCVVLMCGLLATGCGSTQPKPGGKAVPDATLRNIEKSGWFSDIYTDASIYSPGGKAKVTCELLNPNNDRAFSGTLVLRLSHNGAAVQTSSQKITLSGLEQKSCTFDLTLPANEKTGYAAEAYIYDPKNKLTAFDMTAIDASGDWRMYPRMGYIAGSMSARSADKSREILEKLERYHINALYYQDMMNTHDTPLAGTVENPDTSYKTLSQHVVSRQTLLDMLSISKQLGMTTFAYDLMFGAYEDAESRGVSFTWGLFRDPNHQTQDYHGPLSSAWETTKLLLMNPANVNWQQHYAKALKDFITAYPFDGIIVDTLGSRSSLYDYDGSPVSLSSTYAGFLKYLKQQTNAPLLFNPVGGYGYDETVNLSELDYYFMEIWPWTHKTYDSLRLAVEKLNSVYHGSKGISLAAYMDYDYAKNGGAQFNEAGVRYTNSVIFASGGSHMELGDNGMLSSEYYPGKQMRTSDSLDAAVRNEYSFMTAYEHLLRGPGWDTIQCTADFDGKAASSSAAKGSVWAFAKKNAKTGIQTFQFINLSKVNSTSWVDSKADQPAPTVLKDKTVRVYTDGPVSGVRCATPDAYEGIMVSVDFKSGKDQQGSYVEFTMPSLEYWTMVILIP